MYCMHQEGRDENDLSYIVVMRVFGRDAVYNATVKHLRKLHVAFVVHAVEVPQLHHVIVGLRQPKRGFRADQVCVYLLDLLRSQHRPHVFLLGTNGERSGNG